MAKKTPKGTDIADDGRVAYRALAACRIGCYREKGEVFLWPRFEPCPGHLELVDAEEPPAEPPANEEPPAAPGPTPDDIGVGDADPASGVTSADMLTQ